MATPMNGYKDGVIQKELETVERELRETEESIQTLLAKQSKLQEKKKLLKHQLKLASTKKKEAHDWSSEKFAWSDQLRKTMLSKFRIPNFRPLQLETINVTLSNIDCILIMPTGAGKSLCYQLPSLVNSGVTLVISPLVSLMEDQVMALENIGVQAVMLNADASKETVNSVYMDITTSPCKLKLLYVTPEKLAKSKRFMNKLEQCYKAGLLNRIAIDEVHCCSQWGHDFRPDYKFLGILKRQFPQTPIVGLTATASLHVLVDVQKILQIPYAQVFTGSFNRPNLNYSVKPKPANHSDCIDVLRKIVQSYPNDSGIIYCFSKKDTTVVAEDLTKLGIKSACYHADLSTALRSRVHKSWLEGKIKVVVATIAFGMGIDKPDVRFVIHHSLSKSIENYYQESGRAGRDGQKADCILLYRLADVFRQSCMVFTEATGLQKLYDMLEYCLETKSCRRKILARHFNETWGNNSCDNMCDYCQSGLTGFTYDTKIKEEIRLVYEVLDNATTQDKRLTCQMVLDAIKGKGPQKSRASRKSSLNTEECESLIGEMLLNGLLKEDFHFTPYSTISYLVVGNRDIALPGLMTTDNTSTLPSQIAETGSLSTPKIKRPKKRKLNSEVVEDDDVIVLE